MIEGFKLDFSSKDLKKHVESRAAFHTNKADWYKKQVEGLRSGGLRPESVSNDPVTSLERSLQDHKQKAEFFEILASHVIPDEIYRLTENDLQRLEFVSRFY